MQHHLKRNSKTNRRRLETLQRRINYLNSNPASSIEANSYDVAELDALRWAVKASKEWIAADPYWVKDGFGIWRHIAYAYYLPIQDEWWIIETMDSVPRRATEREIEEAQSYGEEVAK